MGNAFVNMVAVDKISNNTSIIFLLFSHCLTLWGYGANLILEVHYDIR